jgi:pimeloyl-ACP methyl ester carboxylesterase
VRRASGLLWFLSASLALLVTLAACDDGGESPAATEVATPAPESGATSSPSGALPPPPEIEWRSCGGPFECADFPVPLDYRPPDGGEIGLSLVRLPAGDSSKRIGSLFVNPGGPGGSAVDFMRAWVVVLSEDVRDRFDVIAFDPRGVGASTPLDCNFNIQDILRLEPSPDDDSEWEQVVRVTDDFTAACARGAGAALSQYGTDNVARDMDRIRQALGDDKLNYLGYSYGTSIGQVYASLFPQNVRAMVLDGVVDMSLSADQSSLEQTLGFEAALQRYFTSCRASRCFPVDPEAAVRDLLTRTQTAPIPSRNGERSLTESEALWGIIGSLYSRLQWPGLSGAINSALNGDGTAIIRLVDRFWGRGPDGEYDNLLEMNVAVNCLDNDVSRDIDHHKQLPARFGEQAPIFGPSLATGYLVCALWDTQPRPVQPAPAAGLPPVLLIGNTGDAATPLKWAMAVNRQMPSSVLITNDQEGHTAFGQGDSCIDRAVEAYLIELKLPAAGARCGSAGIQPEPVP